MKKTSKFFISLLLLSTMIFSAAAETAGNALVPNQFLIAKQQFTVATEKKSETGYQVSGTLKFSSILPGDFSSEEFFIPELRLDENFEPVSASLKLDRKYSFPFLKRYRLTVSDPTLVIQGNSIIVKFGRAQIAMPEEFGNAVLEVSGVQYHLENSRMDFDYENIFLAETCRTTFSNVPVTVRKIEFLPFRMSNGWTAYKIKLTVHAHFGVDQKLPVLIRDRTESFEAIVSNLGVLESISGELAVSYGSLETDTFYLRAMVLNKGKLCFSLGKTDELLLSAVPDTGVLLANGYVPDWFKYRTLAIESMTYSFKKNRYTDFRAVSSPFSVKIEPAMKNVVASLDISQNPRRIEISGILEKPLPVSDMFIKSAGSSASVKEPSSTGKILLTLDGSPVSFEILSDYSEK